MSNDLNKDPFKGIELQTVKKHQISEVNYNLLKDLSEKLGVSIDTTFGVKKDKLVNEIWRKVCAKREQIEAGLTEQEIIEDNKRREEQRELNKEKAKAIKEMEKEAEVKEAEQKQEKKPVTKEYALWAIERLETSLKVKRKTPGQRASTLKKLKEWNLRLEQIEKQEDN